MATTLLLGYKIPHFLIKLGHTPYPHTDPPPPLYPQNKNELIDRLLDVRVIDPEIVPPESIPIQGQKRAKLENLLNLVVRSWLMSPSI